LVHAVSRGAGKGPVSHLTGVQPPRMLFFRKVPRALFRSPQRRHRRIRFPRPSPYPVGDDSAVKVLGDETLKTIARELVDTVKRNATIDWTIRENVRAKLRVAVRRILRKHGYPPDKQEKATQTVINQAELICADAG